ncbi:ROK family transcriptional regulator [Halocynthiibacter sp.]|uniref:ROK family transcriptional regulator n=1 Tax=Halocynthiibacter sp. TaxID=1979210 RepID=UPI003C541061
MNLRFQSTENDAQVRPFNERLILDLVRRNTELSKAEIARRSKLSAQSATVIVNRLVEEGMLKAGKSVRGKVGQPSTPYRLNPLGAVSVGIKVGRRSAEVTTMALDYSIIEHRSLRYDYPVYNTLRDDLIALAKTLISELPSAQSISLQGVGLAIPDALWSWEATTGAPQGAMSDWEHATLREDLENALNVPVAEMNDANAACLASLRLGAGRNLSSFVYFYVGTFIGGGLAFGDQVFEGLAGNAGAIGSLPTHLSGERKTSQLLDYASIHILENAMADAGFDVESLYSGQLNSAAEDLYVEWQTKAADAIAFAAMGGQVFVDPEGIVLDTSLSPQLRQRLVAAVNAALDAYDQRGIRKVEVIPCEVGIHARSLGSALLPYQTLLSGEG